MSSRGKRLIIGLGNPILSDDAAGIFAALKLKERWNNGEIDVETGLISGLKIIDYLTRYEEILIVDTIYGDNPGKYYRLPLEELKKSFHLTSPHTLNLYTALKICESFGMNKPERIKIYVIEAKNIDVFGEGLSEKIQGKIDEFVEYILKEETGGNDVNI